MDKYRQTHKQRVDVALLMAKSLLDLIAANASGGVAMALPVCGLLLEILRRWFSE